jgi:hypothetical protein
MTVPDDCELETVIATAELNRRVARPFDVERENRANLDLLKALVESPQNFFQILVQAALNLSNAESTGISLLDEENARFIWPAIAGRLGCYVGSGIPRDLGPCGTVLERNTTLLFVRPARHFTSLRPMDPPVEEALLIPFHMDGKALGTIWAVIHERNLMFDAEDKRLLESMSAFAESAYRVLADSEALTPIFRGCHVTHSV